MVVVTGHDQKRFRFYNDDGTEATNTAIAAEDTNISPNVYSDANVVLRIQVQESGGMGGASTDDWQLQYSKNAGAYANVTSGTSNVKGFNSATLTDGGATTARLTAGTGSFVAGLISEDGLADNVEITANNHSEFVFTLTLIAADVAAADTLDFRILYNGAALSTYTITPRVTITKTAPSVTYSNLLIGYAQIPLASSTASVTTSADTGYGLTNLFGGSKFDWFRLATAVSGDTTITFDMGSGVTNTANMFFLAKANLLQSAYIGTITIKAHTANSYAGATTIQTYSTFTSTTLVGPQTEDYISYFTTSTAYRYWFINYNATSASQVPHSKMFVGNYFDPGIEPSEIVVASRTRTDPAQRRAIMTFDLKWKGLSYANTLTMYQQFGVKRRTSSIVLFTTSYHEVLHGYKCVYGRITNFTSPPRVTDYNDVSMTVEEMI